MSDQIIGGASSWFETLSLVWDGSKDGASCGAESDETSCTSYSTESSDGFVLDEHYMIAANADESEDLSDIVDSVDDSSSCTSYSGNSVRAPLREYRQDMSQPAPGGLDIIHEETEDYEAYLRSKMSGLWYRIQESASRESPSNEPSTEEDRRLLATYGQKKSLIKSIDWRATAIKVPIENYWS